MARSRILESAGLFARIRRAGLLQLGAVSVLISTLIACSIESAEGDIREYRSYAAVDIGLGPGSFWAPGSVVQVCVTGPHANESTRQRVMEFVSQGSVGSLTFDVSYCPVSPSPGTITVYLTGSTLPHVQEVGLDFNGKTAVGKGGRLPADAWYSPAFEGRSDVQLFLLTSASSLNALFVHEFAHALGITHTWADPSSKYSCPTTEEYYFPGGRLLTKPDPNGVAATTCSTAMKWTVLDELAFEMLYPYPGELPLRCIAGCFNVAGGLVLRSSGSLQDDWITRGARVWWNGAFRWEVNQPGGTVVYAHPLTAETLGPGSYEVAYAMKMFATDEWITGGGGVWVDDAKWTAIAVGGIL